MPGNFRCSDCAREYSLQEPIWRCSCGGLLDLVGLPLFRREKILPNRRGLWKYANSLPVDASNAITFSEGDTPMVPIQIAGRQVWVKQDQLFSTGSYKDRGATLLVSQIKSLGIRHVVEDLSGNAGCAIAAYCAWAGISCDIYVPADTSAGKLAQIEWYGARLVKVAGSREDTAEAVMEAAQKYYYASHSWNPFFFQGTKTFAFEVCEQLGWSAPDWVVLPAGNGTLLLGAAQGFRELLDAGVIGQMPKICAVQAENCSPLVDRFVHPGENNTHTHTGETLAEGIAIARPVRGDQILRAVRESQGVFVSVSEGEILQALIDMGGLGFFIEPTAAAAIAGVKKISPGLPEEQVVVSVFTGHGLKAADKMLKIHR